MPGRAGLSIGQDVSILGERGLVHGTVVGFRKEDGGLIEVEDDHGYVHVLARRHLLTDDVVTNDVEMSCTTLLLILALISALIWGVYTLIVGA